MCVFCWSSLEARNYKCRFRSSCTFTFSGGVMTPIPIWYVAVFLPMLRRETYCFFINLTSGSLKSVSTRPSNFGIAIGIVLSYAIRAIAREEHLRWETAGGYRRDCAPSVVFTSNRIWTVGKQLDVTCTVSKSRRLESYMVTLLQLLHWKSPRRNTRRQYMHNSMIHLTLRCCSILELFLLLCSWCGSK